MVPDSAIAELGAQAREPGIAGEGPRPGMTTE